MADLWPLLVTGLLGVLFLMAAVELAVSVLRVGSESVGPSDDR